MNEKAKQELVTRLKYLSIWTQENKNSIQLYVYPDNDINCIDFMYHTRPVNVTLASIRVYFDLNRLDLSSEESCNDFLAGLKKEIDGTLHNPNFTIIELKRSWREDRDLEQSEATECSRWLRKTMPKVYTVFKRWIYCNKTTNEKVA